MSPDRHQRPNDPDHDFTLGHYREILRVFEDSAPICDRCARQRAPELATLLEARAAD